MSMNEELAAYYGTGGVSEDSMAKEAQVELFAKLAADEGIDLSQLSENQVAELWNHTFQKIAEDEKEEEEEEEEEEERRLIEEAIAEQSGKKEAMAKFAEADYYGRVMAHAMHNELQKVAEGAAPDAPSEGTLRKIWNIMSGSKWRGDAGKALLDAKKSRLGPMAATGAANLGALGLGAGTVYGGYRGGKAIYGKYKSRKEQQGAKKVSHDISAFNTLAAKVAMEKVAQDGRFDMNDAANRIYQVVCQDPGETEKTASVIGDLPTAVDVRSLEILEASGYPITWNF